MRLTLASTSPSRLGLLRMAGIEPVVVAPEVDEHAVAAAAGVGGDPRALVELLASAKADAVFRSLSEQVAPRGPWSERSTPRDPLSEQSSSRGPLSEQDPTRGSLSERSESKGAAPGLILGCDSVFELDGSIYGKPHHAVVAAARWRQMRGRTGVLHTGHCLIDASSGERGVAIVSTEVEFADVSDAEIDWYVATGEPLPVAGAFTLEGLAAPFISRIDGDPHSVVGLSLAALRTLAIALGTPWPSLITHP